MTFLEADEDDYGEGTSNWTDAWSMEWRRNGEGTYELANVSNSKRQFRWYL